MNETPGRRLAICAVVKDENQYLREWVSFHLSVGADFILIVDNSPVPNAHEVLGDFIASGAVEVRRFSSRQNQQREACDRALDYLRNRCDWLAFIDIDEFLFPAHSSSLKDALIDFEDFAAVAINWVSFGSNGHVEPPLGWVTENFTDRGALDHSIAAPHLEIESNNQTKAKKYRPLNSHVKCVVNPKRTKFFRSAHHFQYAPGSYAVDENFERVDGPFTQSVSIQKLRINHYWSKSLVELETKLQKGRVSQSTNKAPNAYNYEWALTREAASRGIQDVEILRLLPKARKLLSYYEETFSGEKFISGSEIKKLKFRPSAWAQNKIRKSRFLLRKAVRNLRRPSNP